MRKEMIIIGIILLLIISFTAGYFTSKYIESDEKSPVIQNNPFLLTLSMEKSTYKIDELINVTVTLRNIGQKTIHFEPFALGLNIFFNITNSSGGRIEANWIDEYYMEKETLKPGETYSDILIIQDLYRISELDTYLISVITSCIEDYRDVYSNNAIEFTIVE